MTILRANRASLASKGVLAVQHRVQDHAAAPDVRFLRRAGSWTPTSSIENKFKKWQRSIINAHKHVDSPQQHQRLAVAR